MTVFVGARGKRLPLRGGGPLSYTLRYPKTTAFLCALLVAAVFVVPAIIAGGGVLYVSNDQVTQQIPFMRQIVKNIHSGLGYDFELDLGSSVIEGYSWYNLGSVFTLVLLLFPYSVTPYLLGPMLVLKFGFAGLLSYLWMRRHTKTDLAALCGSLCYAFCGMAITNMVFPFQDVYTLFPLLPLCMDEAMDGGRAAPFALAVALNVLANPPLFFGTAVFMVLYFAVKSLYRAWTLYWGSFLRLCGAAVCGVMLSSFILLPFVASLAANPRVGGTLAFGRDWFLYVAYRYFEIFRAMVLPAEVMHQNAMFLIFDAVSPEGYLPLFGLVPTFAFVWARRRHWASGVLIVSLACALVPILNSAFNAFNATYYTRWFYMPVMVAALATALFLEDETISLRPGYGVWGIFAALLCVCVALWLTLFRYDSVITSLPALIASLAVCAAGLAATAFVRRLWRRPRVLAALVGIFAVATGALNLAFNHVEAQNAFGPLRDIKANYWEAGRTVPLPEGAYRINSPIANQYFDHGSPFSFNSTVSPGIFELQAAFGRQRTSTSVIQYDEPGLWALLGVKYLLVPQGETTAPLPNTAFYAEGTPYWVVENLDALPFVVGFDRYIPQAQADPLANTQKSIAMLHGLVLGDEAAQQLGQSLEPMEEAALDQLNYAQGVAARKGMAAGEVGLGKNGLTARISMEKAGALLITLPYDAGWQCTLNGETAALVKADYGLMAVACPAGELTLELHYRTPGGAAGLALTAAGLAGLGLLWQMDRRRKLNGRKAGA